MSRPWISNEAGPEKKKHAPATARNRDAIVDVLRDVLPETGTVLEIASGSGEHAIHFAEAFPGLHWQPSDSDPDCLASIAAWVAESGLATIAPPLELDAASADWPVAGADAILCINMIHISRWAATEGLMAGAGRLLPSGAPLYLYGPYIIEGRETAPSNLQFDGWLKERNSEWGLRQFGAVAALAERHGLVHEQTIDMPANNVSLIFRKG
jgi:hypothetical protein